MRAAIVRAVPYCAGLYDEFRDNLSIQCLSKTMNWNNREGKSALHEVGRGGGFEEDNVIATVNRNTTIVIDTYCSINIQWYNYSKTYSSLR